MRFQHRWVERVSAERISEARGEAIEDVGAGMEGHCAARGMRHLAQIVDAVAMVGMIVGDDHAIHAVAARGIHLFAQVGAAGQVWVNKGTIAASAAQASLTMHGRFYNEGTVTAGSGSSAKRTRVRGASKP